MSNIKFITRLAGLLASPPPRSVLALHCDAGVARTEAFSSEPLVVAVSLCLDIPYFSRRRNGPCFLSSCHDTCEVSELHDFHATVWLQALSHQSS